MKTKLLKLLMDIFVGDCRVATRMMSDAAEQPEGAPKKLRLRVHLSMCSGCRNYETQICAMHDIFRNYGEIQTSSAVALSADARTRIREALRSA